ncbi:TM2 domain-containing protein [Pontibacter saemangeumensis]|uniref:TM2 domain-containing protein n=1 Tax=Pontibacter saemangeumensis TaxID=1084525 RepID=A0ABP8LT27_9BACT
MANILNLMPELEPDEMSFVQSLVKDMPEHEAQQFVNIYRARRKEPQLVLITTLIGFIGLAGLHRFILGQIGMGLLYFFTGGLCLVGTIIDVINFRRLAFEYNVKQAQQVITMMRY